MKTLHEIKKDYKALTKNIKRRRSSELRRAKRKYEFALQDYYQENGLQRPKDPPKRSVLEEIGNAISHGAGSIFSIVAFLLMLVSSATAEQYAGAVIYFIGLFLMFTASCLYHSFPHGSVVKRLFRRFDYSCIYLLIGATFAPSLLNVVCGTFGIIFFIAQWVIIIAGITFIGIFGPTKLRFIHIPAYILLGWSAIMLLPFLAERSMNLLLWLLAGGVVYTIGIIPFSIKLKASHFIWHVFILVGAVVQWIGIYLYIYICV